MTRKPFFSIVIPTYNRATDLRFAINCILRQTFHDYEIIISDNCSTDNTEKTVASIKNERIRYYRNSTNIGEKGNYQKGISLARGKYVFLHGDDDFLLNKLTLRDIHQKIRKFGSGFIRVNYVCRTPNKKTLFDFVPNKGFDADQFLLAGSSGNKVIDFIFKTDVYFVSGIVFINSPKSDVSIIDCQPCPWIDIVIHAAMTHGAYYISSRYIVGSWSQWRTGAGEPHRLFDVVDGKLQSESLLAVVKSKLREDEYEAFLYQFLYKIYVCMFPAIKFYTGRSNLRVMSRRIVALCPIIEQNVIFQLYLTLALITPNFILAQLRKYFFYKFTTMYRVNSQSKLGKQLDTISSLFSNHDHRRSQ